VNLRGSVFAVLDLARYLSLPNIDAPSDTAVVLVTAGDMTVGLLSDDVPEVFRIAMALVVPPLAHPTSGQTKAISGVTADLISILDLDAVLSDPRLVVEEKT
jgi:chemotaxis signal transduction protein